MCCDVNFFFFLYNTNSHFCFSYLPIIWNPCNWKLPECIQFFMRMWQLKSFSAGKTFNKKKKEAKLFQSSVICTYTQLSDSEFTVIWRAEHCHTQICSTFKLELNKVTKQTVAYVAHYFKDMHLIAILTVHTFETLSKPIFRVCVNQ